jgi:antitoxin VapB
MEHRLTKPQTAKVFTTGRSQAVRLPKEFRFKVSEVFIRRDETTGEVILSTKAPFTWAEFFEEVRSIPREERDQLPERSVIVTKARKPVF